MFYYLTDYCAADTQGVLYNYCTTYLYPLHVILRSKRQIIVIGFPDYRFPLRPEDFHEFQTTRGKNIFAI